MVADANTGWLKHEAMRVVGAVKDLGVYIEQPCLRWCLSYAGTDLPFMDESIDGIPEILQGEGILPWAWSTSRSASSEA